MAIAERNTVRLWDVASHRELPMIVPNATWVSALAFSPTATELLATAERVGESGAVKLFDVTTNTPPTILAEEYPGGIDRLLARW